MYRGLKPFVVSIALHAGIAGGGMTLLSAMAQNSEALVIDLSMTELGSTAGEQPQAAAPPSQKRCTLPPRKQAAATPARPVAPVPAASAPAPSASQSQPSPVAAPENRPQAVSGPTSAETGAPRQQAQSSASAGAESGNGQGNGNGSSAMSSEQLQQLYTKEHFAYIKRIIASKIRYPRAARMGRQEGTALVSFTIGRDGNISGLHIAGSSGHPLLDQHALEAVRDAAPFPRPPVAAQLRVPIVYSLSTH